MAQLTPHFSEKELGVEGAEQRLKDNAQFICEQLLEPIRAHYNAAINVHDGYRNTSHNKNVGGKVNSFHLFEAGKSAADIDVKGHTLREVFDWIRLESGLKFDKIILEHNPAGRDATVHLQLDRNNPPRRESFVGGTGNSQHYTLVQTK